MRIYSKPRYRALENEQIPTMDRRLEYCLSSASDPFPLSSLSQITASGADTMLASCFSTLAGTLSGSEISNSFIIAAESLKHRVAWKFGKRVAFGIRSNLLSFIGPF